MRGTLRLLRATLEVVAELMEDAQPRIRLQAAALVVNVSRRGREGEFEQTDGYLHTSGDDPDAESMLVQEMSDGVWDIAPMTNGTAGGTASPGE